MKALEVNALVNISVTSIGDARNVVDFSIVTDLNNSVKTYTGGELARETDDWIQSTRGLVK